MQSDSQLNETAFKAQDHLKQIITGKRAKVSDYLQADYPEGWKSLVESFIDNIQCYSIQIQSITSEHDQLDVEFAMIGRSKEAMVWRAIDKLRRTSWRTCSACGNNKGGGRHDEGSHSTTKCRSCLKSGKGGTGTWLDKY